MAINLVKSSQGPEVRGQRSEVSDQDTLLVWDVSLFTDL
jgi:hypothetical protein